MLPDDEETYIDICCDEAERKGREKCLKEGASILRSMMDDSRIDTKTLFQYLLSCLCADGHVTEWEFDLIIPLATKMGINFSSPRDMANVIKTLNPDIMRENEADMKDHIRACSKKDKDRYLQLGILLGACDGRVSEYERLLLLDIFGYSPAKSGR